MRTRLLPLLAALLLPLGACVSEADLRRDWDAHVDAANECVEDTDCAVVYPGCPLGCFDAVRADRVDDCDAEADGLVGTYESFGRSCDYDCPAHDPPFCDVDGRCRVEPASM